MILSSNFIQAAGVTDEHKNTHTHTQRKKSIFHNKIHKILRYFKMYKMSQISVHNCVYLLNSDKTVCPFLENRTWEETEYFQRKHELILCPAPITILVVRSLYPCTTSILHDCSHTRLIYFRILHDCSHTRLLYFLTYL